MSTSSSVLPRFVGGLVSAALGLGIGLTLLPDSAEASIPKQLQPGQRPHFFQFGFGIAQAFAGGYGRLDRDLDPDRDYYWDGPGDGPNGRGRGWWFGHNTFKSHQELGFHLNGTPEGPALGFIVQQELGYNDYWAGTPFGFVIAPRFQWDIKPVKQLALYLAPNFSLGYHGIVCGACGWDNMAHFVDMQFGMNVRLIVVDRFIAWLKLPEFEIMVGPNADFVARYQALTGLGIAFP